MKVVIVGVGTTAMIVADIIMESHNFNLGGFIGTSEEEKVLRSSKVYHDLPFLGDRGIVSRLKEGEISGFICAIGDVYIREKAFYECSESGLTPVNAISSKAVINSDVTLGRGIVISPGVIISHGVNIGDNVILDPAVVMDVNVSVGAHCYISSGVILSGGCEVEKNVTMGAGVIIGSCLKVGKNQTVAAGTVVSESLDGFYRKESE
jgi:sugar O-acyltransferase (sialic acid O-acetyltransferase NeuD family)